MKETYTRRGGSPGKFVTGASTCVVLAVIPPPALRGLVVDLLNTRPQELEDDQQSSVRTIIYTFIHIYIYIYILIYMAASRNQKPTDEQVQSEL